MIPEVGDLIECIQIGPEDDGRPDPDPVPPGTLGVVESVTGPHGLVGKRGWHHFGVAWENGRILALVSTKDRFRVVAPAARVLRCIGPGCRQTHVTALEGEYAAGWIELQFWKNEFAAGPGGVFHSRGCLDAWLRLHPEEGRRQP